MSSKPSRHSDELLAKEGWLVSVVSEESEGDLRALARVAELTRLTFRCLPVSEEQEQRALRQALQEWDRASVTPPVEDRALQRLRLLGHFGHWMRFVFTLGRRR